MRCLSKLMPVRAASGRSPARNTWPRGRPRTLEAEQGLQHRRLFVHPALGRRSLDHGVLAADLVGRHRHGRGLLDAVQDVEVGQPRLHHHEVGAFGDVQGHHAVLLGRWRVHLVGALVAKSRRRIQGVPERAVETRGVLGAVAEDAHVGVPAWSSPARMAPTRPSIMSLGATMSTPAWAWLTAILVSTSTVGSFTIWPSSTIPSWPNDENGRAPRPS